MTESPIARELRSLAFTDIDGAEVPLARFAGQVLLVVNVASRCGFTQQYGALEALYRAHREAGLVILGFPCDQFANQEPGSDDEIKTFCQARFGVSFPLAAKVRVRGADTHPIYRLLCRALPGFLGSRVVKWNFTKFLVGRDGVPLARFAPRVPPERLEPHVRRALAAPAVGT